MVTRIKGTKRCSRCKELRYRVHKRKGFVICDPCLRELEGVGKYYKMESATVSESPWYIRIWYWIKSLFHI